MRRPLQDLLLAVSLAVTLAGAVILPSMNGHRAIGAQIEPNPATSGSIAGLTHGANGLCLTQPTESL